ncbi:amino acid adenylation domain-containing protein [Bradyrhizobium sp. AUGA SZCCT0274]|uniref:non-ribosomal peptide synthetase n=1 Tax=Bradyrhizobium sp. AUGA SZCCT0274 TaxID=2807670 RepID=UPI001BAC2374|nr:non-ribosomal peptide synthetase [Bradyrhizobium sp. AUGA SZCCT0274]MBR1240320.1 amino acid adenylation domain-containing protein [Bradyrhizobium sp. AUGA SZCCT0274]
MIQTQAPSFSRPRHSESDPEPEVVTAWIERRAAATPRALAIVAGDRELTFDDLNREANRVAHGLRARGVGPESIVALPACRSSWMLVALLGIWKAGGAYVPIDLKHPQQRIRHMLRETNTVVIVADRASESAVRSSETPVLCIDGDDIANLPDSNPSPVRFADSLAYCVYTSGTTGTPKGVAVSHRSLLNHARFMSARLGLTSRDRYLQMTPFTIDAALEEVLPAWLAGAAVVITPDLPMPGPTLREALERTQASVVSMASSLWHRWVDFETAASLGKPSNLRLVFVGGEKALSHKLAQWQALPWTFEVDWILDYGPTEATISCTTYRPDGAVPAGTVPIGYPIDEVWIHILNEDLDPVGDREIGEIWIGGCAPARGYVGQPQKTADAFRPDPWGPPGSRMYRSGDLGSRSAGGILQFHGRWDEQIKIFGHRIELGEIEACLLTAPGVRDAAAALKDGSGTDPRLVAYLAGNDIDAEMVKAHLRDRLPQVMIPTDWVVLGRLPRSEASGKLNRSLLPDPKTQGLGEFPSADLSALVTHHWSQVLGRAPEHERTDFFVEGGDSLRAIQLLGRLRGETGIDLSFADIYRKPTVGGLVAILMARELSDACRMTTKGCASDTGQEKPATHRSGLRAASNGQQRLWFLDQYFDGSAAYSVPLAFRVRGSLSVSDLDRALTALADRHEALRTGLVIADGQLMQKICTPPQVRSDIRSTRDWDSAVALAQDEAARPFDLASSSLMRSLWIEVDRGERLWLLNFHHAVCDAWSIGLFFQDLKVLLAGAALNGPVPQFADHVDRFNDWLNGPGADAQRAFWKEHLSGDLPVSSFTHGAVTRRAFTGRGAVKELVVEPLLADRLSRIAADHKTTLNTVLLSAFAALLQRWTLQNRIVVGIPAACRPTPADQATIGYFANILPLVIDIDPAKSFKDLMAQVAGRLALVLSRQELPFDEIVNILDLTSRSTQNPLFQTMFVLQSTPADDGYDLAGAQLDEVLVHSGTAKVDLSCMLRFSGGGIEGELEFSKDVLDDASADALRRHFIGLLRSAAESPSDRLEDLCLSTEAEQQAWAKAINGIHTAYPDRRPIHRYIEAQVDRTPDAVAVETLTDSITYAELEQRANRLAHALNAASAGPENLVGVCLDRSIEMVVALVGILKAGAAFVPLSPSFPIARTRKIIADAGIRDMFAGAADRARFESLGLRVWTEAMLDQELPCGRVSVKVRPDNLAFAYYTSGSTGEPKGVLLDHQCAMGRIVWLRDRYPVNLGDRVLHKTPLVFDVAIWEIFGPLMSGATILAADPGGEGDVDHIRDLLKRPGTVFAHFVPSMLDAILRAGGWDDAPDLRWVQVSGEGLSADLLNRYRAQSSIPIHNCYGQTETSEVAYWEDDGKAYGLWAPIGDQIGLYRIFLLDRTLQPVERGMPGEICVAGVGGLARGYRGRAALTAERFVPHPWPLEPGERLYRSGDLGRITSIGALEYVGRLDEQVKIRGCRVEIAEVEQVLRGVDGVKACAVAVRCDKAGSDQLIAYLEGTGLTPAVLGEQAAYLLPKYMLPAAFVVLDRLPVTASGKLDRLLLPAPRAADFAARGGSSPPVSPLERELADMWAEVLTIPEVGRRDNFFAIGGNSLSAIQVMNRVRHGFGVRLPIREFFSEPTIEMLARLVEAALIDRVAALSDEEAQSLLKDLTA